MRFVVLLIALLVSRTAFAFDLAAAADLSRAEWRPFEIALAAITLLGIIAAIVAWLDAKAPRPVRRIPPRYYQRPR